MIDRYDMYVDGDAVLEFEKDDEGVWVKYEDYIAEKVSNDVHSLLGEVLKIIDNMVWEDKIIPEKYNTSQGTLYEIGYDCALNDLRKKILSIST